MLMWTMLLRRILRFKRDDRGLQLVELALTLPVLILLFAAVAEFGRYFQSYSTLTKGSRVAVRYLATARYGGCDDSAAKNLVVYGNEAGTGSPIVNGLTTGNVSITRHTAGGALTTGFPATVTIEITDFKHTPIFDLGKLMNSSLSLNVDMKASATMRYLLTQPVQC
jgi:Flp pilus assembly protein TadG